MNSSIEPTLTNPFTPILRTVLQMPFSFRNGTAFSSTAFPAAASEFDLFSHSTERRSAEPCFDVKRDEEVEAEDEGRTWRNGQLSPAGQEPLRRNTRHLLGLP